MPRFYNRIRKQLAKDNKFFQYSRYAIGEILLVVIGILIALQINNWNEEQKSRNTNSQYIVSLIDDLKKDSIQLQQEIKLIRADLATLYNYRNRLYATGAVLDTAVQIARYEFLPFFDPSNELNRNTITSLLSTGDIRLFTDAVRNRILQHNTNQLKMLKIMDQNVEIFLNGYKWLPPSEHMYMDSLAIRGALLDVIWENNDKVAILNSLSSVITSKTVMQNFILNGKEDILKETVSLLEYLQDIESTHN